MARARNIKPSFFNNDELAELDPLARLLFIGMWTIADFKGCFEYKPKRLKVQILPYDDCDIEKLAINLDKSGFISIYSVQGQLYVKVLNFDKHQNPHKNEKDKGSDIPDISEADFLYCENTIKDNGLQNIEINRDKNGITHDKNETDRADSLNLIPSTLNPDSLNTDTRNHETSVSSSDKPKRFDFKKSLIEKGGSIDLVEPFMAIRKTKKATNSEKAFELFMGNVEKSGMILNQVLEICIQKDWKGFDPSWLKNQNQGYQSGNFTQPQNNRMQELQQLSEQWELENANYTPY
ncbi:MULTISPECIES: hypothetical protein [Enterobacteriaceae]|uniref:hypothetical protein n=1 Tax=Enterobacteriaceae TaxID=543 RepID=UPI002E2E0EF5|nr:hypothetical protein [Klebsiella pneumoniae]MED6004901.1 hypothetical protein [Klebsiella pneumoniae]MED6058285.1 hypothetical protein [Klebsiella pneumoniae]